MGFSEKPAVWTDREPTLEEELSVTLTGRGPGEARLMMACLTKLD